MIVRPAIVEDLSALKSLKEDVFSASHYDRLGFRFNPEDTDRYIDWVFSEKGIIVAYEDMKLIGTLGFVKNPWRCDFTQSSAYEVWLWVSKDVLYRVRVFNRLVEYYMDEAARQGVTVAFIDRLASEPHRLEAVYERLGLKAVTTTYAGGIN